MEIFNVTRDLGLSVLIFACIYTLYKIITEDNQDNKNNLHIVKKSPNPSRKRVTRTPRSRASDRKYKDYIEAAWEEVEKQK